LYAVSPFADERELTPYSCFPQTGLFAAALATFVVDSYKSLLPNSAANTVVLLAQISQQLDGLTNATLASRASSSSLPQSSFRPPNSAVWVNALWFLSLVISLFCALLATLQQRWARRYLLLTQPQRAIHKRAFIRSFFAEGVSRFHLPIIVEAIPALLHISVFLFLAGLVISLVAIHHTVGFIVLAASFACAVVYAVITVLPTIYHDSPYTSPFSALVWYASRKSIMAWLKMVDHIADFVKKHTSMGERSAVLPQSGKELAGNESLLKERLSRNMTKAANYVALKSDKGLIARALGWTLDMLEEEGELVQFAAGIPGFSRSTEVKEAVSILKDAPKCSNLHRSLYRRITELLLRSGRPGLMLDSKLLPESVRQERMKICLEALYFLPHAIEKILARAADQLNNKKVIVSFSPLLQFEESWNIAERLSRPSNRIHQDVTIAAQCVAAVLATQMPDERTTPIVMRQLNIEDEDTLRRYVNPGDSLLLRNLNNLLKNTALKYIEMDPEMFPIVLSATRLAMKTLRIAKAELVLRDEYEMLLARIRSHTTASLSENAHVNAKKLLSMLPRYPLVPQASVPVQPEDAQAGPSAPPPPDDSHTAAVPATPIHTTGISPHQPFQPILQRFSDTYLPISSPTSYPSTPCNDTYPLVSMPTPNRLSHGSGSLNGN